MVTHPRIRFVYFDLGNVLVDFDHAVAIRNLAALLEVPAERIETCIFEDGLGRQYERGEVDTTAFCAQLRLLGTTEADDATLCHAVSDIFSPAEGTPALVAALQRRKVPIGILSNTCQAHWDFIRDRFAVVHEFPIWALSFELRTAKPDPEIYRKAAELAGVAPEAIFFADDIPGNVAGACAAGMDAVLFTDAASLRQELDARGLL